MSLFTVPITSRLLTLGLIAATLLVLLTSPGGAQAAAGERFRVRHFALGELRRDELPWTSEPRLGFPARKPRDRHGVPMIRVDGRLHYRPGALAINGMKRVDAYEDTGDERQLDQALLQARQLRRMALDRRDAWWVPFWYDYPPAGQHAPWVNAMSQGLALSFFVRLHRVTGDEVHMEAAHRIFRSFLRLARPGTTWVSWVDGARYLWLEHYPRPRPDHVLNAHLHAVFGLYEYWQVTRAPAAKRLLEGAITTMRDHAGRYRRPGGLSLYGLVLRERLPKYHEIHVWQLRLLGRISGDRWFWRLAGRLAQDVPPRGYVPGRPERVVRPPWPRDFRTAGATDGGPALASLMPLSASSGPAKLRATTDGASVQRRAARPLPDFDGDGYADLAVGAPYADVVRRNAGAVHVLHGSRDGLRADRRQVWSQASEGIDDKPERGDQFGWSVAAGDFDGDGFSDLAVASRWEDAGAPDAGAVHVLYGSPDGLDGSRARQWHQDSPGVPGSPGRLDEFGWVLASADFDADGRDDLAIGAHRKEVGGHEAGSVHVLYGSVEGLAAARSQLWHQDSPGIPDRAEPEDGFAKAVAAGDFDGDGFADLAIGVPYEDRHVHRMGIVHVLRGSRRGLTARGTQVWHQDAPGIAGRAELRDQFGQSLAAGDIDRDGRDDLVVGVWYEDYLNVLSNEGGFHVIYGSRDGLSPSGDQSWHQDRPGVADRADISDRFGQALGVADFDGDGFDDVAVGSPSSDLGRGIHQNRGAVHVFFGGRDGLRARDDRYLTQDSPGIADRSEPFDHYGETVAGADFDGDGFDDLVVGLPWEDWRFVNDGAVHVLPGAAEGFDRGRDRLWGAADTAPRRERRASRLGWSISGSHPDDGSPRTGRPRL